MAHSDFIPQLEDGPQVQIISDTRTDLLLREGR